MGMDNNKATIEKQTNINKADNVTVNQGYQKEDIEKIVKLVAKKRTKGDKSFEDPTQKYSISTKTIVVEKFENLSKKIEEIQEHRVLLINSYDQNLLNSATYAIIEDLQTKGTFKCRVLEFKDDNLQRSDLNLKMFTEQKIGKGKSQIFVVHLTNVHQANSFLDSLFDRTNSGDLIKSGLRANNIFVLVIFSSTEIIRKFEENKTQFHFINWYVSFEKYLPQLLRDKFSEEEASYLYENIIEQNQYKLFGDEEIEFYLKISKKIEESNRAIRDEVGSNIEKVKKLKESGKQAIQRINTEQLILDYPTSKGLLYIAAFFPLLSFREFNKLVSNILSGEEGEIEIEEEYKSKKDKIKFRKVKEAIDLQKHYKNNSDLALQKAYLEEVRTDNLSTVVDFREPYLRKEAKAHYQREYPKYIKDQFDKIIDFDLLFDIEASSKFIENIVEVVVETALTDPDYYGKKLLKEIGLGKFILKDTNKEIGDDKWILEALSTILGIKDIKRYHDFNRLATLIAKMLEYPQLKRSVDDFLSSLIKVWKSPEIVLEILNRLRYSKNIDQLLWLKRIFNEVVDERMEIKQRAYNYLILLGRQYSFVIYDFLVQIREWKLKNTVNFGKNKSDKLYKLYSLTFLFSFAKEVAFTLPKKFYGDFPSKYILFARFNEIGENEMRDKIHFLISWLFHKNLDRIFYNNIKTFDLNTINSNADLIEHWSLILLGNSKKRQSKASDQSKKILQIIFSEIKKNTDKLTQKKLRSTWYDKIQYYIKLIVSLPINKENIEERRRIDFKRKNLEKMIKYFNKSK